MDNLTAKELGKRLGITGAAIRIYIRAGILPAHKESDNRLAPWLITPEDAAEFERWHKEFEGKRYGDNWGIANPDHPMHGGVKNPDHPLYKPGMESDKAKRQVAVRLTVSQIEWFEARPEINRNQFIIDLVDKAIEELGGVSRV